METNLIENRETYAEGLSSSENLEQVSLISGFIQAKRYFQSWDGNFIKTSKLPMRAQDLFQGETAALIEAKAANS